MADQKISELPTVATAPADPSAAWLPIVINGVTRRISLETILPAVQR